MTDPPSKVLKQSEVFPGNNNSKKTLAHVKESHKIRPPNRKRVFPVCFLFAPKPPAGKRERRDTEAWQFASSLVPSWCTGRFDGLVAIKSLCASYI